MALPISSGASQPEIIKRSPNAELASDKKDKALHPGFLAKSVHFIAQAIISLASREAHSVTPKAVSLFARMVAPSQIANEYLSEKEVRVHEGLPGKGSIPPDSAQQRIDYMNGQSRVVKEALIHDQSLLKLVGQITSSPSQKKRSELLEELITKIHEKYPERVKFRLPASKESFMESAHKDIELQLNNLRDAQRMTASEDILNQVGIIDAMHSYLADIEHLLKGKLLPDTISLFRYCNLLYSSSHALFIDLIPPGKDVKHTPFGTFYAFRNRIKISLTSNSVDYQKNAPAFHLFKYLHTIKLNVFCIFANISADAAKNLKQYLENMGIDRLLMPMAGSGYLAAQLKKSGLKLIASDIEPPEQTFLTINKMDAFESIKVYSNIASATREDMSRVALMIDAPPPVCMKNQSDESESLKIKFVLTRLLKYWFDCGGRIVVILSENVGEDNLFNKEQLREEGISIEQVIPGFPAKVYKGLDELIGVCGAYVLKPLDSPRNSKLK